MGIEPLRSIPGKQTGTQQEKTVLLILTEACNLSCVYCYEQHKGTHTMDLETAMGIIEREMNSDDEFDRVFEFFGGEPFLAFDKIVALHDFLGSRQWSKRWFTITTTNGTLVHGKIKEWMLRNRKTFNAALSADGTRQMHNTNRSNSYDMIDFDFFLKMYPVVRMTVSPQTLSCLSEGVIHFHNMGFGVTSNLAFGIDWSKDENIETFAAELRKLIDYYLENPKVIPANILDMDIIAINPQSRSYASRYCGAGVNMVAYDTAGVSYPCQTFAPLAVGDDIARKSHDLVFESEISLDCFDEKCRICTVANICPNCYGINFSSTGNMYSKDDSFCRMIKVQFLANANFKYLQYLAGSLSLTQEEEYRLLNNISLVQTMEL
ncbi:MAG: 4Fe-4S cluster-binding domain-containing protein [Oscillospiraceae bacterium]|nr:4Fe-4S cluster-binding domain-containing protein [Oscillospiraceae bacterium]